MNRFPMSPLGLRRGGRGRRNGSPGLLLVIFESLGLGKVFFFFFLWCPEGVKHGQRAARWNETHIRWIMKMEF
jgi:hypothetical protein